MKKFVELNEKELMNVEGGATVEGYSYAKAGCKGGETQMGYYANGSLAAGAKGINGVMSSKGVKIAGGAFSVYAIDNPCCK